MKRKYEDLDDDFEALPQHQYIGLRGMLNLGQTCFLNSICQALAHVPLFRNYFLSQCHARSTCQTVKGRRAGVCVACEFDTLTNALFNGDRHVYNPHRFLYTFWKQGMLKTQFAQEEPSKLAGYDQQDAHEFLGALLSVLKAHDVAVAPNLPYTGVVEHCFGGILRSDVQCGTCGAVSSTLEEFFELSLEIDEDIIADRFCSSTVQHCLAVFTRCETLTEKVHCAACGVHQACTKHLSLHKLPQVLVLHLKRFNHSRTAKQKLKKIENFVEFPLEGLDVAPYVTANSRPLAAECRYDLAGVVQHHGDNTCQSGHYTAFIRHNWSTDMAVPPSPDDDLESYHRQEPPASAIMPANWYLFDDATVYHATREEAAAAEAYLLFYVPQQLQYSAGA